MKVLLLLCAFFAFTAALFENWTAPCHGCRYASPFGRRCGPAGDERPFHQGHDFLPISAGAEQRWGTDIWVLAMAPGTVVHVVSHCACKPAKKIYI